MRIPALALVLLAAAGTAAAQTAYKAPRTSFGRPSLEGYWTNATLTPMDRPAQYGERRDLTREEAAAIERRNDAMLAERNAPTKADADVEDLPCDPSNCAYNQFWVDPGEHVMRVGGVPRTSMITSTRNGRAPALLPEGQARIREMMRLATGFSGGTFAERSGGFEGQNDNPETRTAVERCLVFGNVSGPVMLPTLYNNNYHFVQTKDHLAIWVEMVHDVRIIRIGDKPRADGVLQYMGDSVGWWEGDTLVAQTTGYHPLQSFRGGSPGMKVTERFTRVAPDRVLYQFRVEDPTAWTESWGGEYEFGRAKGAVYEYACHEGNYGLQNILAGARSDERAAAAGPPGRGTQ